MFAQGAMALGLGQIEVRSQRNQPLVAEIAIVSSTPGELDQLQARLASPETFARIGLPAPQGVVSDLRFQVALDARGRPVIRVTSGQPVREPLLTFLVEVDWGDGRLVREYSALVATPDAVAAPAQPPIQAPVAAPADSSSGTIARPPIAATPAPVPEPAPAATPPAVPEPQVAATPTPPPPPAEPAADPDAVAPTPQPAAEPAAPATAAPVAAAPVAPSIPGEYGPVRAGDTLGRIAASMQRDGHSLDQTMIALLRANPEAFIGGNIHLVRTGAVLRMPGNDVLAQASADEARTLVREQTGAWRAMRQPVPAPEAAAALAADAAASAAADAPDAPAATTAGARRPASAGGGRLEITPPSANEARQAGTRSGIEAGGGGDMLRQELDQAKETIAARESEVEELKARVADLEKLQAQQQQLITLKDSELAAAQQRLAESNARTAAAPATTTTAPPAAPEAAAQASFPWMWLGVGFVVAAVVIGLLTRRRRPAPAPSSGSATPTFARDVPVQKPSVADAFAPPPAATDATTEASAPPAGETAPPAAPVQPVPPAAAPDDDAHAPPPSFAAPRRDTAAPTPSWTTAAPRAEPPPPRAPDPAELAPLNPAPAGHERIELARAYIDLGDVDTARSLLREVAEGGDPASREEAAQLLRAL